MIEPALVMAGYILLIYPSHGHIMDQSGAHDGSDHGARFILEFRMMYIDNPLFCHIIEINQMKFIFTNVKEVVRT